MNAPITAFTIAEIELSRPLAPLATRGKEWVLALVTLQGTPLGRLSLHSADREIGVAAIEAALVRQLEWPLVTHVLTHEARDAGTTPPISVVICTRNRPELLERCLASFGQLDYPDYEIIVVDNAPENDATRVVVERSPARYAREDRPGLDWARNRGWSDAAHDIIAYTDDDAVVSPGWLKGIARGFENPAIMAVTGLVAPYEMDTPAQVLFEHVYGGMGKGFTGRLFHRTQMRPSQLIAIYGVGVGANMAFRRAVFQQLGGFDTALDVGTPSSGGGDLDMFHRVVAGGLPLWYEPRALIWHQHRRELSELERQLGNDGRSFGVYLQKLWKTRTVPRKSLVRFATWQWGRWLVGRVAVGLMGRHRMPLPLLWAGLRGALGSPRAYRATYRSDRRLRSLAPALAPTPTPTPTMRDETRFGVSVVVPAYNARETLAESLASVQRQSWPHWEIIVVDDGSTDGTLGLAESAARSDPRITVLRQAHQGVSAARNLGLARARYPWVLFLDADDWVEPSHLERMTSTLAADVTLDAVHCGWSIATASGKAVEEDHCKSIGDLFHLLARHPAFIVHACVIRRDLVRSVGGFDPAYSRIQDWVMWQRVARTGCRFGRVAESLAGYRMQPASVSSEPEEVLDQALQAITLGHGPDSAVPNAAQQHADGRPVEELPQAKLAFLGWPAGILLARGEDARRLLARLEPYHWPGLATYLGEIIYSAAPRALGKPRSAWSQIWPQVSAHVAEFLDAVETHTTSPGLSRAVHQDLARCILGDSTEPFPLRIGSTLGIRLELTESMTDIAAEPGVERLWCLIVLEGKRIGYLELPVCGPLVAAAVLKDAVADRFAWTVLGCFFEQKVYGDPAADHDAIGWDTLLREAWDETPNEQDAVRTADGRIALEISVPMPRMSQQDAGTPVEVFIGGASVGVFRLSPDQLERPEATRTAINDLVGYELCRAVVREALIGHPFDEPSLRQRLRSGPHADWGSVLRTPLAATVFWRHPELPVGGGGSRRALMPVAVVPELAEAAEQSGQRMTLPEQAGTVAAYVPEFSSGPLAGLADIDQSIQTHPTGRRYDRHHFETSFARTSDPWSYRSEYEQVKYEQTIGLVPEGRIERALELGCAEGHFTARLAPRVEHLIAADIADLALARAGERCRTQRNIEFRRLDLVSESLPGENDLVVCSEVLYYAGSEASLAEVAARIADSIVPGGHFLTAHANVVADEPEETGFAWDVPYGAATIARVFGQVPTLRLLREIKTPLYRIQLYQKVEQTSAPVPEPQVSIEPNPAQPDPSIARWIRRETGGWQQPRIPNDAVTRRLPILMYHQVADSGVPARARWRVTPARFEDQLRYLREAGFYSVGLSTWRSAMGHRRPLPGRAVMITFDDGFVDFASHAWPLLRQYGFSAVLFVVSERVGARNDWDRPAAAGDRLLDWDQLRGLCRDGLEIGSHSATHPRLRNLPVEDVAREAARSKATIQRELERPVTAFAYPFGDHDPAIRHLVGACGYDQGFGCFPADRSPLNGDLMNQPRIEVLGNHDMTQFIAGLEDR